MAKVMGMVEPSEWVKRTSMLLARKRGPTLLAADSAYAEYYSLRSEDNKKKLFKALDAYLKEKGGHWERVDRNKKSDGLMKYIYEFCRGSVEKNVLQKRIPEARHGVLYIWQKADISTQWAKIVLEGALNIGSSTVSMLQASNYQTGDKLSDLGVIAANTKGDTIATIGSGVGSVASKLVSPSGQGVAPEKPHPQIHLAQLGNDPSLFERAKHALGKFFLPIWEKIKESLKEMWESLRMKWHRGGLIGPIGAALGSLAVAIVGQVAKNAAPFVSSGIALGQGICQAIVAGKQRILAKVRSSKFMIAAGHPMQIARGIERQMNWAIAKGLYNAAKGGIQLAGNIASWGASALIDVIAACLEFAWKVLSRIAEGIWMRTWIKGIKDFMMDKVPDRDGALGPNGGVYMRPRIVYDDVRFNKLFELGCDASVCIPMMTINTGLAGDQMMFMKMFDDTGKVLDYTKKEDQKEFSTATKYFTQLKEYGRDYLASTGFTFTSTDPVVRGAMWHAIEHHTGHMNTADRVLSFLAGGG